LLENDIPAWIIAFQTQEVLLFRNAKTREVAVGAPDKVEQCQYAAVLTRSEADLDDEITGGWKVVEVRKNFIGTRKKLHNRI
jgi:import inner membrane translocase subunit TIM44